MIIDERNLAWVWEQIDALQKLIIQQQEIIADLKRLLDQKETESKIAQRHNAVQPSDC